MFKTHYLLLYLLAINLLTFLLYAMLYWLHR